MRRCFKITLLALLTVSCSVAADADGLKGRIVGGGTYTVTDRYKQFKNVGGDSGVNRFYKDPPTFTAVTDRIPAKPGVRFGIVFELTNLPKTQNATVGIVLVTIHPPLRRDGTTATRNEQPVRMAVKGRDRIVSWTGFGFERPEDVVPGTWTFEIRSSSKLLCKKDFRVVRING
jgi:Domain of unknown function (DUF3859)